MKRKIFIISILGMLIILGLVLGVTQGREKSKNNDEKIEIQQDISHEAVQDEEENGLPIITPSSDKKKEEIDVLPSETDMNSKSEVNQDVKTESREESEKVNGNKESEKKEESKEEPTLSDKSKMELPFVPAK